MTERRPRPLTLVLKRSKAVPNITVGGLDTIAIRGVGITLTPFVLDTN